MRSPELASSNASSHGVGLLARHVVRADRPLFEQKSKDLLQPVGIGGFEVGTESPDHFDAHVTGKGLVGKGLQYVSTDTFDFRSLGCLLGRCRWLVPRRIISGRLVRSGGEIDSGTSPESLELPVEHGFQLLKRPPFRWQIGRRFVSRARPRQIVARLEGGIQRSKRLGSRSTVERLLEGARDGRPLEVPLEHVDGIVDLVGCQRLGKGGEMSPVRGAFASPFDSIAERLERVGPRGWRWRRTRGSHGSSAGDGCGLYSEWIAIMFAVATEDSRCECSSLSETRVPVGTRWREAMPSNSTHVESRQTHSANPDLERDWPLSRSGPPFRGICPGLIVRGVIDSTSSIVELTGGWPSRSSAARQRIATHTFRRL